MLLTFVSVLYFRTAKSLVLDYIYKYMHILILPILLNGGVGSVLSPIHIYTIHQVYIYSLTVRTTK